MNQMCSQILTEVKVYTNMKFTYFEKVSFMMLTLTKEIFAYSQGYACIVAKSAPDTALRKKLFLS
jgi:hypothetical protein